jgi:septum site-determining protein MinD
MLAIAGGKGGCGKTTTALGLARTLSRRGREPLVVDADCDMPDLHHVAGIERDEGVDALARGAPLSRVCRYPSAMPGVALVTAGRPERTAPALRAARDWEGPVLVDCPAGIGPDATRPLRHARATLVVSTDRPQCLDDTRRTLTAARQLDASPVGALVRTAGRPAETAGRIAGCPVLAAVPAVDDPFAASPLSGAWSRVADQLLDRSAPSGTPDPDRGCRATGHDPGDTDGCRHRQTGERDAADGVTERPRCR